MSDLEKYGVTSAKGFLDFANWLVEDWIPTETTKGRHLLHHLHLLLRPRAGAFGFPPDPIHPDSVGKPLTPLSEWVVQFAQDVGAHLNKPSLI
ncbi:uncharacterized protein ACHE_11330A [Aspergillus chevalieri]|uniref:Uncharacterized protein n=1 Tax=Aspergillus chevalieri TaxID=182096 RepID=A0A7R7ZJ33_ASPCH|nr:uncharacterized protein ACHE_11330A [Aspergillus chevalieri]BCR83928.1 hypothetical protein ACHE_11330A [Aspergillus chevalieri]